MDFEYQENRLSTSARRWFFEHIENVESRLVYHSTSTDYKIVTKNQNLLADVLLLSVSYMPMDVQEHTSRNYSTLIDTLSDIGGFSDVLLMVVGVLYGLYLDRELQKDLTHRA